MKLLIEYFKSKNEERHKEYITCIENNINYGLFDKIYVFIESDDIFPYEDNDMTVINRIDKRPTYKYLFDYCNSNFEDDEVCVISNTDIYFDDTLN